ncbi:MAG TPA: hypothetical protein VFR41_16055, partial [Acidimicrobiia bacterium]|nr:hypothetical protein [Acidimicrobiia bacterium]
FNPHLTLERSRRRIDWRPVMDAIGQEPVGDAWLVDRVVVFESQTLRTGAVHTPRAEIELQPVPE